jgi:hypothetical protein
MSFCRRFGGDQSAGMALSPTTVAFSSFGQRLFRRLDDGGIDHLTTAGNVAMPCQLPIDGIEDALAGAGFDQALFESPDRCAVRNLARITQAGKALEAQAVQQLEFHLFVGEIEQLLDQQNPHHDLGRERRPSATFATWPRCCFIDRRSQGSEVDMPLQHLQRIAKLRQLGLALLSGKQVRFYHGRVVKFGAPPSCHGWGGFSRCPLIQVCRWR